MDVEKGQAKWKTYSSRVNSGTDERHESPTNQRHNELSIKRVCRSTDASFMFLFAPCTTELLPTSQALLPLSTEAGALPRVHRFPTYGGCAGKI